LLDIASLQRLLWRGRRTCPQPATSKVGGVGERQRAAVAVEHIADRTDELLQDGRRRHDVVGVVLRN